MVDAFLDAARGGDLEGLVAILDPEMVLRADSGNLPLAGMRILRGVDAVAGQLETFHRMATVSHARPALVDGTAGLINTVNDELISIMSFTIADGKILAIDILSGPDRLSDLDVTGLES